MPDHHPRTPRRRRRQRRRRRNRFPKLPLLLALAGLGAAALAVGAVAVARTQLPALLGGCTLDGLRPKVQLGENSYVYAANGMFLGTIPSQVHRQPVPLAQISPWLERATVAIEDRDFWSHEGVDLQGTARAAIADVRAGAPVQGASTLDQQVVDNLYLPDAKHDFAYKKREACLALKLDAAWGKQRILARYLNTVYYGHLAYGVEAAARTYFSKHARNLDPAEAALLAGLPQAPSAYDPLRDPRAALERRNQVLQAMVATGALTQKRASELQREPLRLRPTYVYSIRREPVFFEYVRKQLVDAYGERTVRRGGLRVTTTIVPRLQKLARRAVDRTLDRKGDPASALVSIDRSGAIRAMISRFHGHRLQFNLAAQGRNEAGSTFKVFVLTAAIERGLDPFATRYLSAPFSYRVSADETWDVHTYEGTYSGPITVEQALLRSDNTVFARLTLDVGPGKVARTAHRMGIGSKLLAVPSIGLGVNDVSVLEVARSFSTLMRTGRSRPSYAIEKVVLPDGKADDGWGPTRSRRAVPKGVARTVTQILHENVERGTGVNARISRPAAGKTGTTDRFTDAWFTGFTHDLTTSVWVGYPFKNVPMRNVHGIRVQGGSFPALIWAKFMQPATAGDPPVPFLGAGRVYYRPWHGAHAFAR